MKDTVVVNGMLESFISVDTLVGTDLCVYIKFSGFDDEDQAQEYAERLNDIIPILFEESTVIH